MPTADADYAFRLKLSKQVWADYMQRFALDIDYSNFKTACAKSERGWAYGLVSDVRVAGTTTIQHQNFCIVDKRPGEGGLLFLKRKFVMKS